MKIGQSQDIHLLEKKPNHNIYIGNVEINCDWKIVAVSDGDILIHAIAEAIYGAMGLGDLGEHFPEKKFENKNLSSKTILLDVMKKLIENNFQIQNIDTLLIFDHLLISPYKDKIKKSLAKILNIRENQINIKATRSEGLYPNHIMAQAIVLLIPR